MVDSNRTGIYFGEETSWGDAAPGLTLLRYTSESFAYNITNVTSTEIRSDRQVTDLIQSDADASGGFNFEFSYSTFSTLMEGALWSDWSTALAISHDGIGFSSNTITAGTGVSDGTENFSLCTIGQWIKVAGSTNATNNEFYQITAKASFESMTVSPSPETLVSGTDTIAIIGAFLRNGTTEKNYTFVRAHTGLTSPANQYFQFVGQVCNTFNLSVQAGAILTGSFDFMGKNATLSSTSALVTASASAATTSVLNAVGNIAQVKEAGSDVATCLVQGIDFSVANNVRGLKALANLGACDIGVGKCDVTGTMTAFFKDNSLYDKYLAAEASSLSFKCADAGGNAYIIDFPTIEFETDAINVGGQDQDVMETLGFRAIRNTTYGYTIQICRFPV